MIEELQAILHWPLGSQEDMYRVLQSMQKKNKYMRMVGGIGLNQKKSKETLDSKCRVTRKKTP